MGRVYKMHGAPDVLHGKGELSCSYVRSITGFDDTVHISRLHLLRM